MLIYGDLSTFPRARCCYLYLICAVLCCAALGWDVMLCIVVVVVGGGGGVGFVVVVEVALGGHVVVPLSWMRLRDIQK